MAVSKLAPQPVAFYAAVFFLVNMTYVFLIWELIDRAPVHQVSPRVRRIMGFRSIVTLCIFGAATWQTVHNLDTDTIGLPDFHSIDLPTHDLPAGTAVEWTFHRRAADH
jgi:hypothetical protein